MYDDKEIIEKKKLIIQMKNQFLLIQKYNHSVIHYTDLMLYRINRTIQLYTLNDFRHFFCLMRSLFSFDGYYITGNVTHTLDTKCYL